MENGSNNQGDKLERSFLKQNFGINGKRDLKGNPVPDEELKLIDQNLNQLHDRRRSRTRQGQNGDESK
ncbi:hypothetical protein [Bifidobacterium sp.]|jgi:hypothetical protein|uniref:hypothetical protein n=1 Tax=Bifidobacterium sp. TaxID=41200 RepID=UPI0025BE0585|nr:hypothetical protein [Bifidobacterium sp.]MCH4209641.1 hypothetical protein [Bifidobacterium sp.]MCI1224832.1 hypothetical protein [Bifidobacterium sp.]